MASLSFSTTTGLLDQVRRRLQGSLATAIRPQPASQAEAQVWQIGPAVRLLATPPTPAAARKASRGPELAGCPTLLVYEYVSSKLGAQLRAQGIYYADAAGNAWLRHPELLVSVQGCAPAKTPAPAEASPARQVQLLLFQLLLEPAAAAYSLPNLATHTQLPEALVKVALARLAELGLWRPDAPLGQCPLQVPAAAQYWLGHYAHTLRRRLNAHRYRLRDPAARLDWLRQDLAPASHWGGEAAARLLLGQAPRPESLTLYTQLPRAQVVRQLGLEPYAQGPIEILNAFAPPTCFAAAAPPCVPPLLVYADLLASSSLPDETLAPALHAQFLAGLL